MVTGCFAQNISQPPFYSGPWLGKMTQKDFKALQVVAEKVAKPYDPMFIIVQPATFSGKQVVSVEMFNLAQPEKNRFRMMTAQLFFKRPGKGPFGSGEWTLKSEPLRRFIQIPKKEHSGWKTKPTMIDDLEVIPIFSDTIDESIVDVIDLVREHPVYGTRSIRGVKEIKPGILAINSATDLHKGEILIYEKTDGQWSLSDLSEWAE